MNTNLSTARTRATVGLVMVLAMACGQTARENVVPIAEARDIRTVPIMGGRVLRESSGAAMSRRQGPVVFTIEDSGNPPVVYAFDTSGADRGSWRVLGAKNVDWEAIASAPCTAGATTENDDCLYVGDVGDNMATKSSRVIYRIPEPDAIEGRGTVRATSLTFTYSDGPHDVEAMYVAPNADIVLITKRPLTNRAGRLRPALVFLLPASAWSDTGRVIAELVDSLPVVPRGTLTSITDASLSHDGKHLVVRTYAQAYVFATDSTTGRVNHAIAPSICDLAPLGEPQGEGVAWVNGAGRFAFTSEGKQQPLRLANCPLP